MDTILGIAGVGIGICGIVIAYVFYRLGLRIKEPYYSIVSYNIHKNIAGMAGVRLTFENRKIDNAIISKILFWNNGKEIIEKKDIISTNPLRIECVGNAKILSIQITQVSSLANHFSIKVDGQRKKGRILFEYLDEKQGGLVTIFHTGENADSIRIVGEIKGAKIKRRKATPAALGAIAHLLQLFLVLFTPIIVVFIITWAIFLYFNSFWVLVAGTVFAILTCYIMVKIIDKNGSNYIFQFNRKYPAEFGYFEEEDALNILSQWGLIE